MILWKLSSRFSLTFSNNLRICNAAYDSCPGFLVTIVSVLFARYALKQKQQLSALVFATMCVLWEVHAEAEGTVKH